MKYLIVANQTLGGDALASIIEFRSKEGAAFHVVVPATEPHHQHVPGEGDAAQIAQQRLDEALARFGGLGARVTGEVGDSDPMRAVEDALGTDRYGGIVVSTLPAGVSRWLKMDLPHRIERHTELPIEWIETAEEEVAAPLADT